MNKFIWTFLIVSMGSIPSGVCQSNLFSVLQGSLKQADQSYSNGNYFDAIEQYNQVLSKNPTDTHTQLKLAQSYYRVKNYKKSIGTYNKCISQEGNALPLLDTFWYAEAQSVLGHYDTALVYYGQCLKLQPDNELFAKKVWRLKNIHYLYEDSAHIAIRPVQNNTTSGELCPVLYRDGIVFTSNRKESRLIDQVNGRLNAPFYQLYTVSRKRDSTEAVPQDTKTTRFATTLKSKYNTGPVAFYNRGQQMVFVASSALVGENGRRPLGLYFASLEGNNWKTISEFPFNSADYSINDVTISEDGATLYFSSDMKGGIGGKDIYTSQWVDGRWSKPHNAGEPVNTMYDEVFPYLHATGILYFSSDGHAGLGALDIFKSQVKPSGYDEPQNLGYPLNSGNDDFGLTLDSLATHGYLASNRKNGSYDDDIYEFDMDLQAYPFTITGLIKYKEHSWSDQSAIQVWHNAKVFLVDSRKNTIAYESTTDEEGNFSITIPYFSRYYMIIVGEDGNEHKASLEIQKYRTEASAHEIVIVKDIFTEHEDQK